MSFSAVTTRMHQVVTDAQSAICSALESIDGQSFLSDTWERSRGGGGLTRVLSDGDVFEKAGVNVSAVHGPISSDEAPLFLSLFKSRGFQLEHLDGAQFFATGVSLVIHPRNPFVPTTHANYRYFECLVPGEAPIWWFGGGADLTPYYLFDDDATHFHHVHKDCCDTLGPNYYSEFKQWCDRYFFLPHRNETRGIGGVFFDYLHDRSQEDLASFASSMGQAFIDAYVPIVTKRKDMAYSDREKQWQEYRRGRYAEFNLLYDRGTKFGLQTNGRIESILMSLPPVTRWMYGDFPDMTEHEKALIEVLKCPKEWV